MIPPPGITIGVLSRVGIRGREALGGRSCEVGQAMVTRDTACGDLASYGMRDVSSRKFSPCQFPKSVARLGL